MPWPAINDNPHWAKPIDTLWKSRITDLEVLKELLPGSVMIAFDTEASCEPKRTQRKVCEAGLACLRTDDRTQHLWSNLPEVSLREFTDNAMVDAYTFRLFERPWRPSHGPREDERRRYGNISHVNASNIGARMAEAITRYEGRRILVGFDIYQHLQWMAQACPNLSSLFTAWIDLTDPVRSIWESAASDGDIVPQVPGLRLTLKGMRIANWRSHSPRHHASNDALGYLTILSYLLSASAPSFKVPSPKTGGVRVYNRLSRARRSKCRFAVRITNADGSRHAPQSPWSLTQHFAKYDLEAVALNWPRNEQARQRGAGMWFVALKTEEAMDTFLNQVDGLEYNGKKLCAVRDI